ncbi:MAG TPA: ATP-grasp domain-containing protein [Micromonosporaceae bacterium]
MTGSWLVLVESNTTGSGRLFCARARDLGLRPVLLARDPGRYPYVAEDGIEYRVVDTTSVAEVAAACAGLDGEVAGVTSSSEYFVATAHEVARSLGRPHPDPDAVRACRDKHTQRERLRAGSVPCPAFAAAASAEEAVRVADAIGLPVVVKPVAGSGSIGVRRCATLPEVRAAAAAVLEVDAAALALPPQHSVVVESYLDGAEYSVETLDDRVIGVTRKHLGAEPYFVEIGHDFPAPLDEPTRSAIHDTAVAALRALGLGWGPAHIELRVTASGPYIIEVNPRLAGGMIPRMVEEATGIDMIFQAVARAAGLAVAGAPTRSAAASIRFLVAPTGGRLIELAGVDRARALPGVAEVGLTKAIGEDLTIRNSFQDRLGYLIATAADGAAAARLADAARNLIEVRIEPAGALVGEGA